MAPAPNEGNLAESSFCEVLAELSRRRETGVLRLSGPAPAKSVYLQEGRIVFASSTDPDDRLGELLLTRGIITRPQLDDASRDLSPGKRLGTALVEKGFLPASDLPKWVREQVKEILFSLFSWTEGTCRFEAGPFPSREAVTLRLSTSEIFLSGLRQVQKWSVLRKGAGEIRIPYRLAPEHGQVLKEAPIGEEEERLLSLLRSKSITMEQAAVESSLSTLRVYQLFFAFRVLGVIHPVEAPAPNPPVAEIPISSDVKAPEPAVPQPPAAAEVGSQTVIVRVSDIPGAGIPESVPPGTSERPTAEAAELARADAAHPSAPAIGAEGALPVRQAAAPPVKPRPASRDQAISHASKPGTDDAAHPLAPAISAEGALPDREATGVRATPRPASRDQATARATEPAENDVGHPFAPAGAKPSSSAPPRGAPADPVRAAMRESAVPQPPEDPALAPPVKRGKPEFRVVKVEARRLESDGSHHIEELLRQWIQKGYHLAGVVPGTASGLFGSASPSFLIFTRDLQS